MAHHAARTTTYLFGTAGVPLRVHVCADARSARTSGGGQCSQARCTSRVDGRLRGQWAGPKPVAMERQNSTSHASVGIRGWEADRPCRASEDHTSQWGAPHPSPVATLHAAAGGSKMLQSRHRTKPQQSSDYHTLDKTQQTPYQDQMHRPSKNQTAPNGIKTCKLQHGSGGGDSKSHN